MALISSLSGVLREFLVIFVINDNFIWMYMRLVLFFVLLTILALLVDYYVYRRITRRHNFGRYFKIFYLLSAFLIDTIVIGALLLYHWASDGDSGVLFKIITWAIGIFFVNLTPKLLYAAVSLGDYVVQRFRKGVSHYFGYTGVVLGVSLGLLMLYSMFWGRTDIRVTEVDLTFSELPQSFDGLSVVQFADNHLGIVVGEDKFLNQMVERINALEPDIVANCGDLVNSHSRELNENAMKILAQIKSRYGVYSVMGNHDLGIYIHDTVKFPIRESVAELIQRQEQMGWRVLINESVYVKNGSDSIVISGLNYPSGHLLNGQASGHEGTDIEATYAGVPNSLFNLVLSHTPQLWDSLLKDGRGDLTLSGHVHAMQIKIKLGKRSWSPAQFMYDRWSGLYEEMGQYLYINDGLGYVMFPMRVGTKPEITHFTLHSSTPKTEVNREEQEGAESSETNN